MCTYVSDQYKVFEINTKSSRLISSLQDQYKIFEMNLQDQYKVFEINHELVWDQALFETMQQQWTINCVYINLYNLRMQMYVYVFKHVCGVHLWHHL
jgi:hypothetical protein